MSDIQVHTSTTDSFEKINRGGKRKFKQNDPRRNKKSQEKARRKERRSREQEREQDF
jgi:hypothetical protein